MDQEQKMKPGQMALVALKNQNNKCVEMFKKPAMPKMKLKSRQIILTEDKYLSVSINTLIK